MPKPPANIHDAFFKQALADPKLAGTFLREHLPSEIAGLLSPEPPEPVPGSFVDEEMRQHHTDLLFRVQLKSGPAALAYVVVEHKSSPDPGAPLQLLRYVVRVLTDWYDHHEQQLPLPPVLPLLVHQGPEKWTFSCEFIEMFGTVPNLLRPYLPSFRHILVDLARVEDRDLSSEVGLRAFLKALKYSRRPDLPDHLHVVLAEASVLEERHLLVILTYLDKTPASIINKLMHETLLRLVPERKEKIMGWITQPYYEKGLAEGEAKGEAKLFTLLLEKRFGAIPAPIRQRIFEADVGSIEAWVKRVFDAPNLNSVFDPN